MAARYGLVELVELIEPLDIVSELNPLLDPPFAYRHSLMYFFTALGFTVYVRRECRTRFPEQ